MHPLRLDLPAAHWLRLHRACALHPWLVSLWKARDVRNSFCCGAVSVLVPGTVGFSTSPPVDYSNAVCAHGARHGVLCRTRSSPRCSLSSQWTCFKLLTTHFRPQGEARKEILAPYVLWARHDHANVSPSRRSYNPSCDEYKCIVL